MDQRQQHHLGECVEREGNLSVPNMCLSQQASENGGNLFALGHLRAIQLDAQCDTRDSLAGPRDPDRGHGADPGDPTGDFAQRQVSVGMFGEYDLESTLCSFNKRTTITCL